MLRTTHRDDAANWECEYHPRKIEVERCGRSLLSRAEGGGSTSLCIGKPSDGGDIGCRYAPEMMGICRIALQLRAKGIINF